MLSQMTYSIPSSLFRKTTAAAALMLVAKLSWALDPFTIQDIRVEGLQRVEPGTIFASMPLHVGDDYNDEKGSSAIRSLFALGFQAFLIIVCVAIYAVLVKTISLDVSGDINAAIWTCIGYTVLLCFTLFKSGSVAKGIFGAH